MIFFFFFLSLWIWWFLIPIPTHAKVGREDVVGGDHHILRGQKGLAPVALRTVVQIDVDLHIEPEVLLELVLHREKKTCYKTQNIQINGMAGQVTSADDWTGFFFKGVRAKGVENKCTAQFSDFFWGGGGTMILLLQPHHYPLICMCLLREISLKCTAAC